MKKKKKWKKKRGSSVRIQGRDIRGFHSQIYIYIRNTKKTAVDHEGSLVSQILRDSVWHVRFTHLNSDAWLWFFFLSFYRKCWKRRSATSHQSGGDYYPIKTCPHLLLLFKNFSSTFQGRSCQRVSMRFYFIFHERHSRNYTDTHTKEEKGSGANRDWITTREVEESVTEFSNSRGPSNHPLSRRGNERDWRHLSPLSFSLYYSYDLWRRFTQTHAPPTNNKKNGGGSSVSRRRRDGGHF